MSETKVRSAPGLGEEFTDASGRVLTVMEVRPGEGLGREVIGTVDGRDYSTTLISWSEVWLLRAPPLPSVLAKL